MSSEPNLLSGDKHTDQFSKVTLPQAPKTSFAAFVAVWTNGGNHVVIGAPTLEGLEDAWSKITSGTLNPKHAQRIAISKLEAKP